MGAVARVDRMEAVAARQVREFEDAAPYLADRERLRVLAARDGFLFVRALVPADLVAALRVRVLDYARRAGWLDPDAPLAEARAAPAKRVGYSQDPAWTGLQVEVMNADEMWALGECVAIHRLLHAVEGRASYLNLSTANSCRVFSPHPDMATRPHQDAYYVRTLGEFWTVWMPLGDCPRTLGPLALLAGSHRFGLREHADHGSDQGGVAVTADAVWSTTDFRCGDAVMFRPHTLHCALPNESGDRLRFSADFRYGFWDASAAFDWRASALQPEQGAAG
jgi:ectoine hydroxylase-related dioxygenase (phytanoyl-CoA dioxygenase family)